MIPTQLFLAILAGLPILVEGQSAAQAATPSVGQCPSGFTLVRPAGTASSQSIQTLNPLESSYVQTRHSDVLPTAWKAYYNNVANTVGTAIPFPQYVTDIMMGNASAIPNLGIATSGGGYRAAIFGAGIMNALDGRNSTSVSAGTGGLLQTATYLTGLSGGAWLVTSLTQSNFPPIPELIFGSGSSSDYAGWLPTLGITAPTNDTTQDEQYIADLLAEVKPKHDLGFPITAADLWSRALARHFVNGTTSSNFFDNTTAHGAGITFSGLANLPGFASQSIPFPIVVANTLSNGENNSNIITAMEDFVPITNVIYEFSVYEMGSYDPMLSAFTPTKYLGTSNSTSCVTGYDQAAFIAGTSSELFNEFNSSEAALSSSVIGPVVQFLNQSLPQPGIELDVTRYPNPFLGVASSTFIDSARESLKFVDGGEDGEEIPLQPLLVKAREVDVIIAIDASANETNWADGSSLIASQNRSSFFPSIYDFPPVPTSQQVFIGEGLTSRPTFFGCNSTTDAPLIIYLANGAPPRYSPVPPLTNTSSLQLAYELDEIEGMLEQTWAVATQGMPASSSGDADPTWPACLACAVVDRARNRTGAVREGICADCFERYCWSADESAGSLSGGASGRAGVSVWTGLITLLVASLVLM